MGNENAKRFTLRDLPALTRIGLSLLVIVMLGGLVSSGLYMRQHYDRRDRVEGFSMDDIRGAYHGVENISPMILVLENGHQTAEADANLSDADRQALLGWLRGERVSEDFDNFDLGDNAPAEIIARNCLSCHARSAENAIGETLPLEYWDDVESIAFSQKIEPTDPEIVMASLHTHSLSLAMIGIIAVMLASFTFWPRALVGLLAIACGGGLALDVGSWVFARQYEALIWLIVGGGVAYAGSTALLLLGTLMDLWRPRFGSSS